VVLFAFVFGNVIAIPDGNYREYLLAGVLVQSLAFGIMGPAISIASDLREGVVDRFRSLPMSRAAYLVGHVLAELGALTVSIVVLSLSGLLVGWGIHADLPHAIAGYAVVLLFAFATTWCGTLLGLVVRSADAAQGVVFTVVFPASFLAATYVPLDGLSPTLRTIAAWNPMTALATAVRTLFGNPTAPMADPPWPVQHCVVFSVAWSLLLIALAMPAAIRAFRRRTTG
jgi:ABC-type multidrug transport system permease subunit